MTFSKSFSSQNIFLVQLVPLEKMHQKSLLHYNAAAVKNSQRRLLKGVSLISTSMSLKIFKREGTSSYVYHHHLLLGSLLKKSSRGQQSEEPASWLSRVNTNGNCVGRGNSQSWVKDAAGPTIIPLLLLPLSQLMLPS